MKTIESKNIRAYKIPQDLVIDVLRFVILNNVKYRVAGVKEKENILLLEIDLNSSKYAGRVRQGIESMLEDYREYMKEIVSDDLIMAEDEGDY